MPILHFWHDLASSYSYPSAMRVEAAAAAGGVTVRWRPFLLAPIFKAAGWETSPFNLQPAKGAYMWRDLQRLCASLDLPFRKPETFPQRSLSAARIALLGHEEGWGISFSQQVYQAEFGNGRDIGDETTLATLLEALGQNAKDVIARSGLVENKQRLRAETEEAAKLGIFGAPTFATEDGELFWGNDRLEQAVAWAAGPSGATPRERAWTDGSATRG